MNLRAILPTSRATAAFLGITVIQGIVDSTIVAVLLHSFEQSLVESIAARNEGSVLPVYLGL